MEKGDRSASPPRPDHLRDPSGFSAKKTKIVHSHPTHTGTLTSAPTPPHSRNRDSCIQILNRTSNVPRTHTSAHTHTSSHRHTLTPTHNGTPVLSHPYIPSTHNTHSQACDTHVLAPGAHLPHIHTGASTLSPDVHGLPPNTHADPHIPNTP